MRSLKGGARAPFSLNITFGSQNGPFEAMDFEKAVETP
jgi:hypothetical protein